VVIRDDVSSVSAVVFGTLVSVGALGAALPVIASGGALAAIVAAALTGGAAATAIGKVIRDRIVERLDAVSLENVLLHGGLVVFIHSRSFIRARDPEREEERLRSCATAVPAMCTFTRPG
jgi:intracellular septation protein A